MGHVFWVPSLIYVYIFHCHRVCKTISNLTALLMFVTRFSGYGWPDLTSCRYISLPMNLSCMLVLYLQDPNLVIIQPADTLAPNEWCQAISRHSADWTVRYEFFKLSSVIDKIEHVFPDQMTLFNKLMAFCEILQPFECWMQTPGCYGIISFLPVGTQANSAHGLWLPPPCPSSEAQRSIRPDAAGDRPNPQGHGPVSI